MARPSGVRETKPRNTAAKKQALAVSMGGPTMLQIMVWTAQGLWEEGERLTGEDRTAKRLQAAAIAEKAAPYQSPKLAATTLSGPDGGPVPIAVQVYLPDNGRDSDASQAAARAAGDVAS